MKGEKQLEKKLVREVKKLGGKALKFTSRFETGWPDRLVLLTGRTYWVEMKSPGGELSPRQKVVRKELTDLGFPVWVIDTEEKLDDFIDFIITENEI
jgi:hypothetical protein